MSSPSHTGTRRSRRLSFETRRPSSADTPLHITVFDGGEISVEDVASVRADTDGRVNVADTPKVAVLSASGVAVRNCETVIVRKGISVVAYDCGRVIIEEEPDVADA